ncbi:cytochrome b/b6 domain-containing protein [Glaciibacter sp. 2TAF33]|uniref:cytochrome b/b6 domain-containing protein n=1 Tax=Glaciibacter sp. 2TAF33 TaxID=3233015 RepID=UPI003F8FFD4E
MAIQVRAVRRGLPRRPGGDPWPPAGLGGATDTALFDVAEVADVMGATDSVGVTDSVDVTVATDAASAGVTGAASVQAPAATRVESPPSAGRAVRRGLPRVPGGELWPPASGAHHADTASGAPHADTAAPAAMPGREPAAPLTPATDAPAAENLGSVGPTAQAAAGATVSDVPLRRGLPRAAGSDPWPPAGFAPAQREKQPAVSASAPVSASVSASASAPASDPPAVTTPAVTTPAVTAPDLPARTPLPRPAVAPSGAAAPAATLPTPVTATGADRPARDAEPSEPRRYGRFTRRQWTGALLGGIGLLIIAAAAVLFVRWFITLEFMQDFLTTFPGEYHLPEAATPGFPAWVQWQHFFNVFLMVLIIRSGLQVRTEKRPGAFWTPKWSKDGKGKISLALWFHQSLDILWLVNGVAFVVLLFVTGHWMRIVPTSWEVFPNALSAMLQYVSLDWPTENGWVNYNSLQQLMYFLTVFIAAPLAAITGVRMSGMWPKNAKALNRAYPVEWARALHFPVMLYFVGFIFVHVALVFATGALRNLNHMYAGADVVNWAGFWIFFGSLVVIVGGWIAARPLVLAPIAKLSGKVTGR